jgi:AraC family transcriptional regulator of adaptative response / DNA-3-methyladenine glycosylase II
MLGITDRHLRRAFVLEYGAPPVQYVQTRKLLLAKSLLTDTDLSITEVAMTAGFGSIRRFNDVFKTHYKLAPSCLRRIKNNVPKTKDAITLLLGYRPPYEWEGLLSFLAERAIPGIEAVSGNTYRRTAAINSAGGTDGGGGTVHYGWIAVTQVPEKNSLAVTVASSLLPVLPKILTRVRHLFDLNSSPVEIYEKLSVMNELALQSIQPVPQSIPSAPDLCMPGVRVPGCFDSFEMAVRAVLGQQITVKAARTLGKRFAETLGRKIETPFEDLFCVFPGPKDICNLKAPVENTLGPLGITGMRARSILALAEALIQGQITLSAKADPENEIKKLLDLPGIGTWTAQYIALRALGWPDAFPHTDYGVKKALGGMKSDEILKLSEAWRPWRSYAVINLWNSIAPKKNKEVQS